MHRLSVFVLAVGVIMSTVFAGTASVSGQAATPTAAEVEANKALVRRYFEIAGSGDLNTLTEVVSPDLVILSAPPGEGSTLESLTQTLAAARTGLPDFAFRIDDLFAEGDLVVVRTTISGTHLGDFFGAPPTGKRIETTAIDIWRVADGKLTENWHFEDILGVMQQLGAIPGGVATPSDAGATALPDVTAADAATLEANVALARRLHDEIFMAGDLGVADEILAPAFVWHNDFAPGVGVEALATSVRTGFPDLELSADQVIAEGDRVAIVWTLRGTHQGEFAGVPASGRSVVTSGADIYRIENGQIAELWTVGDNLGLLTQLGAIPSFGGEAATPASA